MRNVSASIISGDGGETQLRLESRADVREQVSAALASAGVPLLGMMLDMATLEDVFLELTRGESSGNNGKEAGNAVDL